MPVVLWRKSVPVMSKKAIKPETPLSADFRSRESRLVARIQAVIPTLSANDRRIAEYLLGAFPRCAWETVETIASQVQVSKAAVIRFAVRLGYEGFAGLQRDLQDEIAGLFASPLSLLQAMGPGKGEEAFNSFRQSVLQNVTNPPVNSEPAVIADLAKRIARCKGRVFLIGTGKSYAAAFYAHYLLNLMLPNVVLIQPELPALSFPLLDTGAKDIVIGICVRSYAKVTMRALRLFRDKGAHVLVVTDSLVAPPAQVADAIIVAPTKSSSLFGSALMTFFYLEAIANAVASECRATVPKRLAQVLELDLEFETFEVPHFGAEKPKH